MAAPIAASRRRRRRRNREDVSERGKDIARQWQREIDDEIGRTATREHAAGPWRAVPWIALWLLWLVLTLALVARINPLG
jgi:hypothetical protein